MAYHSSVLMIVVDSSWNVMAHSDAQEWKSSTLHTTSEHGVSSITTTDAHTLAARSRLNWRPRRFKWTRPFRWKTKTGFCACAITFQLASTTFIMNTGTYQSNHMVSHPMLQLSAKYHLDSLLHVNQNNHNKCSVSGTDWYTEIHFL